MIIYKVAKRTVKRGEYVSALVNHPRYQRVYRIGKTTGVPGWIRDGYGICVFGTFEHARDFSVHNGWGDDNPFVGPVILECETGDAWCPDVARANTHEINVYGKIIPDPVASWPEGTLMVDALTPVRVVHR